MQSYVLRYIDVCYPSLRRELVLQVMHEIVHLLGADECIACIGSLGLETASQGEAVAIAQVHGAGQFYTAVQESGHTALAVAP